jgi:predicted ribosome quality control (RQC) complex YloA/Tae2 family protein
MRITLNINKNVDQNASVYFEEAKKARKKLEGAKKAFQKSLEKKTKLEKEQNIEYEKELKKKQDKRKLEWYEKFRWFYSSDGFLIIAGRDATTNEIVIKKHTDSSDFVLHTDMSGSPFAVIKSDGKNIPETTIKEAAEFTASFSRAWKLGLSNLDVFCVKPEQVTKETKSGEYITKGSFMIYGNKKNYNAKINLGIGSFEGKLMSAPLSAIKKHCKDYFAIEQGTEKSSNAAKMIQKKLGGGIDEIIRILPQGLRVRK